MPTLYIVRGIPGSGKSTLAKKLVPPYRHCESDMFFMKDGEYLFVPSKIKEAHEWCLGKVSEMMLGFSDCAVSNTFCCSWEYKPYVMAARKAGYDVQIIDCHGEWKDVHGVPEHTLKNMRSKWEPYPVSAED